MLRPIKIANLGLMGATSAYAGTHVILNGQTLINNPYIYDLNPWSLVIFCGFAAYLTLFRGFTWWAVPTAIMAGFLFDFSGTMIAGYKPDILTYMMWVYCPSVLFFVIRPRLKLNLKTAWLPWYIASYALANHLQAQFWQAPFGLIFESSFELFWCFVFVKTFIRTSDPIEDFARP